MVLEGSIALSHVSLQVELLQGSQQVANPYYYSSESGCNQLPSSALVVALEVLDLSVLARMCLWWMLLVQSHFPEVGFFLVHSEGDASVSNLHTPAPSNLPVSTPCSSSHIAVSRGRLAQTAMQMLMQI